MDKKRFEIAPCYLCGYNGELYFQPDIHPCAKEYHADDSLEAQLSTARQELATLKHTIVATIGGVDYEGVPTSEINYLQRLRILLENEQKWHVALKMALQSQSRLREAEECLRRIHKMCPNPKMGFAEICIEAEAYFTKHKGEK
jgi:hypothetical protein